jgi:peptidoglycan-associated lipoprotein
MRATTLLRLSLSLLLAAGLAACGSKRPPAVSTGERGAPAQARPSASDSGSPLEGGPDLQPLPDDGMRGEDVWGGTASAEGGPLADVYFGYDSAELSDEARATLEQHARWLQAHPEARVSVEGHCDERGTVEYNLALGDQRAKTVADYLTTLGVSPERLASVSFGKERPIESGHDEAAWAKNRRAHFKVSR